MISLYCLLSPLLLLVAIIYRWLQPRQINDFYGYRTRRSMANQAAWEEANRFASRLFLGIAMILNIFQAICFLIFPARQAFIIVSIVMVLSLAAIIPLTEIHLRKRV